MISRKGADTRIILAVGIMAGLMYWLYWFVTAFSKSYHQIDPRSLWHRNRQFGFVTGLVTALAYGLGQSLAAGFPSSIAVSVVDVLALGIAVGLVFPATWQVTLASAQLWRRARLLRVYCGFWKMPVNVRFCVLSAKCISSVTPSFKTGWPM